MKTGRNDPCHCGSGEKYKKCCIHKDEAARSAELAAKAAEAAAQAAAREAEGEDEGDQARMAGAKARGADTGSAKPKTGPGAAPPLFRRKAV